MNAHEVIKQYVDQLEALDVCECEELLDEISEQSGVDVRELWLAYAFPDER